MAQHGRNLLIWVLPSIPWYRINNRWTKPENFAPFGDTVTHWDPFLSLDGNNLYFSAQNNGKADIWFVEKQGKNWGKPQSMGPIINNTEDDQCQAILNKSGTVYFSAGKIVRSKLKNENYFHPDTLPVSINQGRYNSDPYIAPDDSYLLFCSRRLNDQVDIYISFHDTITDTWSEPINMGEPINTKDVDRFPAVSPDGKYLFFTRYNGYEKSMDVYWVSSRIIDRLRKNRNVLIKANI